MKPKRLLSLALSLAMTTSLLSVNAFAAESGNTYTPGTFKTTAQVKNTEDNDDEWVDYSIDVAVTVDKTGKISAVDCDTSKVPSESTTYVNKAVNGTKKATGVPAQIVEKNSTDVDTVSGATYTSEAIIDAVKSVLNDAPAPTPAQADKTALQAKVDEVKALTEADYTADSWANLQTALTKAQTVLDKADATQEDVDAQVAALTAAVDALVKAPTVTPDPDPTPADPDGYTYLYAALSWGEYWASENVYEAGNTASSDKPDSKGELDKGAFDTVSRATTNHGLHRGSFQCSTIIEAEDGSKYEVSHWSADGKTLYLTDGTSVSYNRGEIAKADGTTTKLKDYKVTGIKYVPVKVKTADLEAFKAKYATVENGDELVGGYSENNLKAYSYTAAVDATTNGLKTATKNADGSFSFSDAQTGSGSGIQGETLKKATAIEPEVKEASGSYGEFLRVDLNGDYGGLGAAMQSVTWTYYGNDSTYTTPLRTFGTKFAADNWMHKSMGIQLGLTHSVRCELPAGTDGTGYWKLTVHALGYQDYTYEFEATRENIVGDQFVATDEEKAKLQALVDQANALNGSLYEEKSWKNLETERDESVEVLAGETVYAAAVEEQVTHLTEALNNLKGASGYVWMSIPYADFYKAETGKNNTDVDVFSSATKSKPLSSLAAGSYHKNADGTDISGIVFPVKVSDLSVLEGKQFVTDDSSVTITTTNRGQTTTTTYTGKDALFQSQDYSYYVITDGTTPTNYKTLTVDEDGSFSFSKVQGTAPIALTGISVELTTETSYGDYQIDLKNLPDSIVNGKVYGVVLNTTDGWGYGLRHLENIWRGSELAFCTGFTAKVHNCPTSSVHYKSIMRKTIDSITYYTDTGVYTISANSLYVPVTTGITAKVADGKIGSGSVDVTLSKALPDDFNAKYSVKDLDVKYDDGKLNYENAKLGEYELEISDDNGKYAPIYCTFVLATDQAYAAFNGSNEAPALVAADGIGADGFADYLKAISTVSVNGTSYSASGRGAVKIVNADGTINLDAAANGAKVFGEAGTYELTVSATGYPELSFSFTVAEKPDDNDKPGDTEKPGDNDKPGDTEKPGDNTNTGDNTKPGDTTKPADATKPSDNGGQNAGNNQTVSASSSSKQDTAKTTETKNVKTGDSSFGVLAASLLVLSGATCAALVVNKRRKRS